MFVIFLSLQLVELETSLVKLFSEESNLGVVRRLWITSGIFISTTDMTQVYSFLVKNNCHVVESTMLEYLLLDAKQIFCGRSECRWREWGVREREWNGLNDDDDPQKQKKKKFSTKVLLHEKK